LGDRSFEPDRVVASEYAVQAPLAVEHRHGLDAHVVHLQECLAVRGAGGDGDHLLGHEARDRRVLVLVAQVGVVTMPIGR